MYPAKPILLIIVLLTLFGMFSNSGFSNFGISPAFAQTEPEAQTETEAQTEPEAENDQETDTVEPEALRVTNIEPVYVARGANNYMVTLRAHVTNNSDSEIVTINVAGKDDDGYVLQRVRFSNDIPSGKTRVMMERFQIRGETYEKITTWEVTR